MGTQVKALQNGNIIVTDPFYEITSPTQITAAGAVFLYNGRTGALISKLTGRRAYDWIGTSVTVLTNGNYVVSGAVWDSGSDQPVGGAMLCSGTTGCSGNFMSVSNSFIPAGLAKALPNGNYLLVNDSWDNGSIADVGAVTFCNGITGCIGEISPANSLVGSNAGDKTGGTIEPANRGIVVLPNGDYVVSNHHWNNGRGAVTFGSGTTGITGVVSSQNSLVGINPGDGVGGGDSNTLGIIPLKTNNGMVVTSYFQGRGAVTKCTATPGGGCVGSVSAANSLTGAVSGDGDNLKVTALANGNYVAVFPQWDLTPDFFTAGAVTFCQATAPCVGTVSVENSLTGSHPNDRIGEFGVLSLTNGNYIVKSPSWFFNFGAVTFCNGTSGCSGTVSSANSLVGTQRIGVPPDRVGERQFAALSNGGAVIASDRWFDGRGAVTFFNGETPLTGEISAENSLVGSTPNDRVGFWVSALTNGNYVVASPTWDNGAIQNVGAATFCLGTTGCNGYISAANSLIGVSSEDGIANAHRPIIPLTNGNYIVSSPDWNAKRGAVSWGNGTTGITGIVSASNSLVGSATEDSVGVQGIVPLPDGNYVVNSSAWKGGFSNYAGAITWGNGSSGTTGAVSPQNSLVGKYIGTDSSNTGLGGGIYPLTTSGFIVRSRFWSFGTVNNAGAISLGRSGQPTVGEVSAENSVRGTLYNSGSLLTFDYDYANRQMVVGNPDNNVFTLFRYNETPAPFDFDGDGKTDLSIFRPSVGEWWISKSSGGNYAAQFGNSSDKLVPADFTGDGKTDIAIFRPSFGEWFVLRSEDASFYSFPFGTAGDIPFAGDFDADGKADNGVFRPSNSTWYIRKSSDGAAIIQQFGQTGDVPVIADYDGDGKSDIAIYRIALGEWWIQRSTAGTIAFQFGNSNDKPVQGDYTGDGKADVAIFRPNTGEWFVLRSGDQSYYSFPFGTSGDIPSPGDYDGDGRYDATVFRPSNNTWYSQRTTAGTLIHSFGQSGDTPVPSVFVP